MKFYIYTLSHPLTGEIRYIGKTNDLQKRLWTHCNESTKSHKSSWIKSLKGLKPIIEILEEFDNEEICYQNEIYWISQFKAWGFDLVNYCSGGKGAAVGETKGELNGNTKITKTVALKIAELLRTSDFTTDEIANQVSVSKSIVNNIKYGHSWSEVTGISSLSTRNKGSGKNRIRSIEKRVKALRENGTYLAQSSSVLQYDLDGNLLNEFSSISEASRQTGTNRTSLTQCLNNQLKTANKFVWKRK